MARGFLSDSWYRVAGLKPRLRAHVRVHRHRTRGQAWYVVQDALTGRIHRFTPVAYLLVGSMNGRRSVDEIWNAAVAQLGEDAPTQHEVIDLLAGLGAADLVQTDADPDAERLLQRVRTHERQRLRSRYGNPLALRLKLVDPDRFLDRTAHLVRPFTGTAGFVLWLAVLLAALVLTGLRWPELSENVADRVLGAENLVLMAALFPLLKLLHELGHAYAVKLRGGEVHEIGVMLLVFAPVPYVDASASAAFRSRRDRIAVGLAGMAVEVFVAALAVFVWALVEPGPLRAAAFNVMVIAGVSTVVFNANPLMRLDGYYVLSDLLDIPNLGQRANRFWLDLAERWLFGVDRAEEPVDSPGERAWFALYAPLALAYRMVVLFGIALFVASEFLVVGVVLAILGILGGVVWPLGKAAAFVLTSPRLAGHRTRAVLVTFGGLAAAAALALGVPVPLHTMSEGVLWLPENAILRMREDGFVRRVAAESGARIGAGDLVVDGEEPALEAEAAVTEAQADALRLRLAAEFTTDRLQAEVTRAELRARTDALARLRERLGQLALRSPGAGTLIVPRAADLPGRFIKRGDIVGFVLPRGGAEVRVIVGQADVELVRERLVGTEVMLAGSRRAVPATVLRDVPAASDRLPSRALAIEGGGRVAVDPRGQGNEPRGQGNEPRTLERLFQVDLLLPAAAASGAYGARVLVRFDHRAEPLAAQGYRRLRQLLLTHFQARRHSPTRARPASGPGTAGGLPRARRPSPRSRQNGRTHTSQLELVAHTGRAAPPRARCRSGRRLAAPQPVMAAFRPS